MMEHTAKVNILTCAGDIRMAVDLEKRLETLGYHVCGRASSSNQAVDLAKQHKPDLVLMDIPLPGGRNGVGAAECMWKNWGTRIIFLTAEADIASLERAASSFPFGFLRKPLQDIELKIYIKNVLRMVNADAGRRKTEDEINRLFRLNPAMLCIAHTDGYFKRVNPAFERILGYSESEMLTRPLLDFIHPHDREATVREISRQLGGDFTTSFINRYICKDNTYKWLEWVATPAEEDGSLYAAARDITRQKAAEEESGQSREMLRAVLDSAPAGVVVADLQGHILLSSELGHDILGGPILEKPHGVKGGYKLFRPDGTLLPDEERPLSLALAGQKVNELELLVGRADGKEAIILASASPLTTVEGRVWGGVTVFHDITRRKRAEAKLEQFSQQRQLALDAAAMGWWHYDPVTQETSWDERYQEILGVSGSKGPNSEILKLLHPEDLPYVWTAVEAALDPVNPAPYAIQYRINRPDGLQCWVEAHGLAIFEGKGDQRRATSFVGTIQDVTERKRAEEKLRQNERQYRELVENANSAIIRWKRDGTIAFINEYAQQLFGYTPEEVIGQPVDILVPKTESNGNDLTGLVRNIVDNPENYTNNLNENVCRDGRRVWMSWTNKAVRDEHGRLREILAIGSDMTSRKQMEEEKEKLHAQLIQAQKMEAVGTLAGGISHDFNNLLQAVNGYTQILLMDRPVHDPEYQSLKAIKEATSRASDLVRQLLLFSRKADTKQRPTELNHGVEHAKKLLQHTIPKMIDIEVRLASRPWSVNADPLQMEQILLNLGTNAADAMPDGGRLLMETENVLLDDVYARTHLDAQPGAYVLLKVSDTGHGMDEETMAKIYEPFFTTKEIGKGTGLGMASVYGIVKHHGGYISCYSEVGQGTTFRIYLPAINQPDLNEAVDTAGKPPPGRGETILLVDDEGSIRGFAKQALVRFGYTVLTASSGEEAFKAVWCEIK